MSSFSLGRLQFEVETRLQKTEDDLRRVDRVIDQVNGKFETLRRNMERPINTAVNIQDNTLAARAGSVAPPAGASIPGTAGQNTGGTAVWNGQQYKVGQPLPGFPGGGGPVVTGFAPGQMQVRFGNNDPTWTNAPGLTIGGTAAAPPTSPAKTPLGTSAAYYSTDKAAGRLADDSDLRIRSSRAAAFLPLGPDEGRRNLRSHNDALINALNLDALDDAIPGQMKATQDALRRDSRAADVHEARRAQRIALRDSLRMQRDMNSAPLTDRELIGEQIDRMAGLGMASSVGGGKGGRVPGVQGEVSRETFAALKLLGGGRAFAGAGMLGIQALAIASGMGNAGLDYRRDMAIAGNDPAAQARAEMNFQVNRNNAIPMMGGLGLQVRNWVNGMFGGPTTQGTEENIALAQKQERLSDLQLQQQQYLRQQGLAAGLARNARDPIAQARLQIRAGLVEAKEEANAFGNQMRSNGATEDQVKAAVDKRKAAAEDLARLQRQEVARMERLTEQSLKDEADIVQLRAQGKGHAADRAELEKKLNENIRAHDGDRFQGYYIRQRDAALSQFDRDLGLDDRRMRSQASSDVLAYGYQGQGMDFAAAMQRTQEEARQTLSRIGQLFGTGSTEYLTAQGRYGAQLGAMRAEQGRRVTDYFDSSATASDVAVYQSRGDVLGAQNAALENERRRRLREDVPKLMDPANPTATQQAAERAINAEIDARKEAAAAMRKRTVDMAVDDLQSHTAGNVYRLGNKPITGDVVEQYNRFRTQYLNVQGSDEEKKRIRGAMVDSEVTDLRIMQKQLIEGTPGGASRIEAGQMTHRAEDNKYLRDTAEALKAIQGMIAQLLGSKNGMGDPNFFGWRGG